VQSHPLTPTMSGPKGLFRGRGVGRQWKKEKKMYLLILFMPLISASLSGISGRKLGGAGAGVVTSTLIVLTSLLS
jgi:hypothetical protein